MTTFETETECQPIARSPSLLARWMAKVGAGIGGGGGGGSTSPLTTKGDLWGFSTVDARFPKGSDGTILQADNAQALGLRYSAVSGDATLATGGALTLASTITAGGPTGDATHTPAITYDAKGRLTAVTNTAIALGATGDATGTLPGALTLATVNSNVGTFGDDHNVAQVTVNGKGLVTAAANVPIDMGLAIYGDGSDGDVTIGTTQTLTRDMYYNNLTVQAAASLQTVGLGFGGFRIFVKGTLTIDATGQIIGFGGNGAAGGTSDATGGSGEGGSGGTLGGSQNGGNSFVNGNGSVGGNSLSSIGGNGGHGGAGDAGAGNNGGSTTRPLAVEPHDGSTAIDGYGIVSGAIFQFTGGNGGGPGAGSATHSGGAGGSGGGVVVIAARNIVNNGTVNVHGGNGGAGATTGNNGGGGGGGGGAIVLVTNSYTGSGTMNVSGGTGGAGNGTGATGSSGSDGKVYTILNA